MCYKYVCVCLYLICQKLFCLSSHRKDIYYSHWLEWRVCTRGIVDRPILYTHYNCFWLLHYSFSLLHKYIFKQLLWSEHMFFVPVDYNLKPPATVLNISEPCYFWYQNGTWELCTETNVHVRYQPEKLGEDSSINLRLLQFQIENYILTIVNKFTQTGLLPDKKLNWNTTYSLNRNWMNSVLGLNIPLKNPQMPCTGDWSLRFQV
jgi:hypothetical protein